MAGEKPTEATAIEFPVLSVAVLGRQKLSKEKKCQANLEVDEKPLKI